MKAVLHVVLFLGGLFASGGALRSVLPGRGTQLAEAKIALFAERADRYDTLFLGSSRGYRGFAPVVFDAITGEAGMPTRSFNFGAPGARATDIYNTLCKIERCRPTGLRWVFVDPERLEFLSGPEDLLQEPVIDWHDLPTTVLALRYVLTAEDEPAHKAIEVFEHLRAFYYRETNVGAGLSLVGRLFGRRGRVPTDPVRLGPAADGWRPLNPEEADDRSKQRETFLANFPRYRSRLKRLEASEVDGAPARPASLAFLLRIARKVEELGATPIFVIQPGVKRQHDLIRAARDGQVPHLLRYDRPAEVPELYDVSARWDSFHLNEDGARLFTTMLAQDFVSLYKTEQLNR